MRTTETDECVWRVLELRLQGGGKPVACSPYVIVECPECAGACTAPVVPSAVA